METTRTRLNRALRARRSRSRLHGTAARPRLCVNISNRHVQAQLIDDDSSRTLAASSSVSASLKGSLSQKAQWVGEDIAKKAAKAKLKRVIFDRGARLYHGRVKVLADAARAGGLEF